MKIALIHDHLVQEGGAEKVLRCFQEMYPDAPTYTLLYDKKKLGHEFQEKKIITSSLQKIPFGVKKYQWMLPLMPVATERYNLQDYDVVLSSTSAFAKGVITQPNTVHICYCHTPTRYLWTDTHNYVKELGYNRIIKKIIPLVLNQLRIWDKMAAERVDLFLANSITVQKRIKKYYSKESKVVYPPVEVEKFDISEKIGNYYLIGGRLVPYKRYDLAIKAFNKMGIPLKIFGIGPDYGHLKSISKPNIEFLGRISEKDLPLLYSKCIAFLHPQEEDFGITAVEAMASGRPVIAYASGGALETVKRGKTGEFFQEQEWEGLADTVIRFKPENYNPNDIKEYSRKFSKERFEAEIKEIIANEIEKNDYRN